MITIYGASDDLVEVDGCEGADEFYVKSVPDGHVCWHGDLIAPGTHAGEQMRVHAIYDGCWHFAAGQVDEDVPFPLWPLTIRPGSGMTDAARKGTAPYIPAYTVVLSVDAPEGTRLTSIWPKTEED